MDKVQEIYDLLLKKYKRTILKFKSINITLFIFTAASIIMNIYAIRFNPSNQKDIIWLFVSVAILSAISAFISSIISLFVYRKRNKDISEKLEKIREQKHEHKFEIGDYEKNPEKDLLLMERVTKILNI